MKKNDELDYSVFIERYIDNEMERSELNWFTKELDNNLWLQSEVNLRRKVNKVLAEERYINFRQQLAEITAGSEEQVPARKTRIYASVGIAATLAIGLFLLSGRGMAPEKLYAELYQPYEITANFRTSGSVVDNDLKRAMHFYSHGEYTQALNLFVKVLSLDPARIGLNFYAGVSHMEMEQYERAGASFGKVTENPENLFYEQAEWYMALCYLATGNSHNARSILQVIRKGKGFYARDARKALKRLKNV